MLQADGAVLWAHRPPGGDFRNQEETFSVSADGTLILASKGGKSPLRFDLRALKQSDQRPADGRTPPPKQDGLRIEDWAIYPMASTPGLEKALAALWSDIPVQRCTVHKHRNLLAHAPDRLHDELSADYKDMIYVGTKQEIETKRKAFIRKWRLKCKAVADSLEEAGDKLFTFTRFPKSQWKSIRTSNAIERLHEEFKRRIKTQTVLPSAETAAMLFWALLASGQITMRKVDGWQSLAEKPSDQIIDLAA
jgi:putative transposase